MEESVEERSDSRRVAEQFPPVINGPIRGDDGGRSLMSPHDEFEQFFRGVGGEFSHGEVIDDEQWNSQHGVVKFFDGVLDSGVGNFFE